MTVRFDTLGRGKGPYTDRQLEQLQEWIDEDWESHDFPREGRVVLQRLLDTIKDREEKKA